MVTHPSTRPDNDSALRRDPRIPSELPAVSDAAVRDAGHDGYMGMPDLDELSTAPTTLIPRRRLLVLLAAGATTALAACSSNRSASSPTAGSTPSSTTAAVTAGDESCTVIPEETPGPFPGDGSNGRNVLDQDGVVRSDIRSSFGTSSSTAPGLPLTMEIVVEDASTCRPVEGAAVYAWHCDAEGRYSMYSDGVTGENYLRGVQPTGADGVARFLTIFPGAYNGRWPHVHFEVFPSVAEATESGRVLATSQIALPPDACIAAYGTTGYTTSRNNYPNTTLESDMVFRDDGAVHQLGTVTGTPSTGMSVRLRVPVRMS